MTVCVANLTLEPPVLLAPLAGITDLPFRRLVLGFGAAGDPRSKQLLFGNIPEKIARGIDRTILMVRRHPDILPRRPTWDHEDDRGAASADEIGPSNEAAASEP